MFDAITAEDPGWATTPCRLGDPEDWFPVGVEGGKLFEAGAQAAKARCFGCPMLAECRAIALTEFPAHGIWGGMTPDERRATRRSRQVPA